MSITIYESFAVHTLLPVKLSHIRDFILDRNIVARIERHAIDLDPNILQGAMHLYRDLGPPYAERPVIARIGYPKSASIGVQRLIQVKEMLHIMDPADATSPTKDDVERFVCDLLVEGAEREIGLAAREDHAKLLNALCILMPRDALELLRPEYKRQRLSLDQIAELAKIPRSYAAVTLTEEWRKVIDFI